MKREVKLILDKACDSLVLSVELFNRPYDRGRVEGSVLLLDHAFEMLLKASILMRGGKIREKRARDTITFEQCLSRCRDGDPFRFLTEEQAITLGTIHKLRDATQHHFLDISESQFYIQTQAGFTSFRDILLTVFSLDLRTLLPNRVLPISTSPPIDLETLFDTQILEIIRLLKPRSRKNIEAQAKLRSLAILEAGIMGEQGLPTPLQLRKLGKDLISGKNWHDLFPGVFSMEMTSTGSGPTLSLKITKKEGPPIQLVGEGNPNAIIVAQRRVNELGFYSFGLKKVAELVGLGHMRTLAIIKHLGIQEDPECFKLISIDHVAFKRYSEKAVSKIKDELPRVNLDEIWSDYVRQQSLAREARRTH